MRRLVPALVIAIVAAACSGGGGGDTLRPVSTTTTRRAATTTTTTTEGCPEGGPPTRDVPYARRDGFAAGATSLDVYPTVTGCPAPVVIWVHGGGWRAGDKANGMAPKAAVLNGAGYVLVSVNYRLFDPADADPAGYPAANEDVAAAVAWVQEHIAEHGGDPDRIVLLGHSAGAQIAASVGLDPRYLAAHDLGLDALACVGPLDTEGFDVSKRTRIPLYRNVFGADPAQLAEASPITYAAAGTDAGDFLLVERGTISRVAETRRFADALRAAGVPVTVISAPTYTHAQVSSRIGRPDDTVMTAPLMAFLGTCFA